jgi:hypothetical protein
LIHTNFFCFQLRVPLAITEFEAANYFPQDTYLGENNPVVYGTEVAFKNSDEPVKCWVLEMVIRDVKERKKRQQTKKMNTPLRHGVSSSHSMAGSPSGTSFSPGGTTISGGPLGGQGQVNAPGGQGVSLSEMQAQMAQLQLMMQQVTMGNNLHFQPHFQPQYLPQQQPTPWQQQQQQQQQQLVPSPRNFQREQQQPELNADRSFESAREEDEENRNKRGRK